MWRCDGCYWVGSGGLVLGASGWHEGMCTRLPWRWWLIMRWFDRWIIIYYFPSVFLEGESFGVGGLWVMLELPQGGCMHVCVCVWVWDVVPPTTVTKGEPPTCGICLVGHDWAWSKGVAVLVWCIVLWLHCIHTIEQGKYAGHQLVEITIKDAQQSIDVIMIMIVCSWPCLYARLH